MKATRSSADPVAEPVFDEPAMRALMGCTGGPMGRTSDEWLDETREPVSVKEEIGDRSLVADEGRDQAGDVRT